MGSPAGCLCVCDCMTRSNTRFGGGSSRQPGLGSPLAWTGRLELLPTCSRGGTVAGTVSVGVLQTPATLAETANAAVVQTCGRDRLERPTIADMPGFDLKNPPWTSNVCWRGGGRRTNSTLRFCRTSCRSGHADQEDEHGLRRPVDVFKCLQSVHNNQPDPPVTNFLSGEGVMQKNIWIRHLRTDDELGLSIRISIQVFAWRRAMWRC